MGRNWDLYFKNLHADYFPSPAEAAASFRLRHTPGHVRNGTTPDQERTPASEPVWERPWSVEEIHRSSQSYYSFCRNFHSRLSLGPVKSSNKWMD
ncbi:WASH complex subunit 2C [Manis javanica]|nr:WASH complex subunit 2C [Manis javanica]